MIKLTIQLTTEYYQQLRELARVHGNCGMDLMVAKLVDEAHWKTFNPGVVDGPVHPHR